MLIFANQDFLNPKENINIMKDTQGYFEPHLHEFVELVFIASGEGIHTIDGKEYPVRQGDLLFINVSQTHAFSAAGNHTYYNILYLPEFFSHTLINSENIYDIFRMGLFAEFQDIEEENQRVRFTGAEYEEVLRIIQAMKQEFDTKKQGYRCMLDGYSRLLFAKLLRKMQTALPPEEPNVREMMYDCLSYIDAHCFDKLSLQEVAAKTFYNPTYFSRLFKKVCGMSLTEYIKNRRMEKAEALLLETRCSVSEIMEQVGYHDKKLFYKHFKEQYHKTPAGYRQDRSK